MTEAPLLYSITVAAHLLSIKRSKLYELISEGRISVVHIDGRTLVPAEEINRFVAALPKGGGRPANRERFSKRR